MHVCAQISSHCTQALKVSILGSQENYSCPCHLIKLQRERQGENLGVMD